MSADDPIAATPTGRYRGRRVDGVAVWRGIRYATAPRFGAPVPVPRSDAELEAVDPGPLAWQPVGEGPERRGEDCLRLHVWAPVGAEAAPVLVWIHGGGFIGGDPAADDVDGADLARATGLVVVTLGYRVGPFGFLDLRDRVPGAVGNAGLRDLVAALRWLADGVAAFGGDPARVTIAGQSAGAGCVAALLASPLTDGLFAAAIAQSPPTRAVLSADAARGIADRYLASLAPEAAAAPLDADPTALLTPLGPLLAEVAADHPGRLAFAPVTGDDVLPTDPTAPHPSRVPLLAGWNRDEASAFRGADAIVTHADALERWTGLSAAELAARHPGYPSPDVVEKLATELWFGEPTRALAAAHDGPTWLYRFDRAAPGLRAAGLGATHGVEAGYLFGNLGRGMWTWLAPGGPEPDDLATRDAVRTAWASLATTGSPGPGWPPPSTGAVRRLSGDTADVVAPDLVHEASS